MELLCRTSLGGALDQEAEAGRAWLSFAWGQTGDLLGGLGICLVK